MKQDEAFEEIRAGRPARGALAADELLAFFKARLDEAETKARDLLRTARDVRLALQDPRLLGRVIPGWHSWPEVEAMCERALREIAAGRQLLAWHADAVDASELFREKLGTGTHMATAAESYLNAIRALAAIDSDHPDYNPAWALGLNDPETVPGAAGG